MKFIDVCMNIDLLPILPAHRGFLFFKWLYPNYNNHHPNNLREPTIR
jgi:hypothetical protein